MIIVIICLLQKHDFIHFWYIPVTLILYGGAEIYQKYFNSCNIIPKTTNEHIIDRIYSYELLVSFIYFIKYTYI